jgi:hypothetical protein
MRETAATVIDAEPVDAEPGRGRDDQTITRRRRLVAKLRISRGLSIYQIAERVQRAGLPGASAPNIHRDLTKLKKELRKKFSEKGFDAPAEIGARVMCYEAIIHDCMRDAARTNDLKERALLRKVAADTSEKLTDLLERCGLVGRRAFVIPIEDDGRKMERIPSGIELQRLLIEAVVHDHELISEAERALLYGDQAAAEIDCNVDDTRREP